MEYTKGEWGLSYHKNDNTYNLTSPNKERMHELLAQIWFNSDNDKQEANARLIAAAPELLEVCKESFSLIKKWSAQGNVEAKILSVNLEQAINKAEGK